MMEIDLSALEPRHAHDLMTSAIIPRPIAWVSTLNTKGQPNIAPLSFFSGVSWAPPVLAVSVVARPAGVHIPACKACADQLGVTEALENLGVEVIYWGGPLRTMQS